MSVKKSLTSNWVLLIFSINVSLLHNFCSLSFILSLWMWLSLLPSMANICTDYTMCRNQWAYIQYLENCQYYNSHKNQSRKTRNAARPDAVTVCWLRRAFCRIHKVTWCLFCTHIINSSTLRRIGIRNKWEYIHSQQRWTVSFCLMPSVPELKRVQRLSELYDKSGCLKSGNS